VPELLARIDTSVGCSIKASFASLDLATYGFRCCVPKQVSKRRNARQFASPLRQGQRCSALAFCAHSRIGKVREIDAPMGCQGAAAVLADQ
jgi:hypothetical protein